jgi:hypothetical protein
VPSPERWTVPVSGISDRSCEQPLIRLNDAPTGVAPAGLPAVRRDLRARAWPMGGQAPEPKPLPWPTLDHIDTPDGFNLHPGAARRGARRPMSTRAINLRLDALRAAGISVQEHGQHRYKVGPGFSYWPSTDRWRSPSNDEGGDGVQSLIRLIASLHPCEPSREDGSGR